MYRFYRSRGALPRAIVTRADAPLPCELDAQDWQHTLDRGPEDTNGDVRHEVDVHGYCLIENECSFEQLARELERAVPVDQSAARGTMSETEAPRTMSETQSSDEYHFYVHRMLKAWRMAFRSRDRIAALTRLDDWRFARSRSAADTAPAVRNEIAERGYCLFKIGGTLAQLGPTPRG